MFPAPKCSLSLNQPVLVALGHGLDLEELGEQAGWLFRR
jgi:hypothetical protein